MLICQGNWLRFDSEILQQLHFSTTEVLSSEAHYTKI